MPRDITYLTVQDHLWINFQVTQRKHIFGFAPLEEATFYQYAYGTSTNVLAQAARYAVGFPKKAPFALGNEATTFVGLMSFLMLNGYEVTLTDDKGASFLTDILASPSEAEAMIAKVARTSHHEHHASVSEVAKGVIAAYPKTIAKLNKVAVA